MPRGNWISPAAESGSGQHRRQRPESVVPRSAKACRLVEPRSEPKSFAALRKRPHRPGDDGCTKRRARPPTNQRPGPPSLRRGSGRVHLGFGTWEQRWSQRRKRCRFSRMGTEEWFPSQEKRWEPRVRRPGRLAGWGLSATRPSGDGAGGSRRNRRACSWRFRGATHAGHPDALGDRRAVGARGRTDAGPS